MWTPCVVYVQACLECLPTLTASFFVTSACRCLAVISGVRFHSHAWLSFPWPELTLLHCTCFPVNESSKLNFEFYCLGAKPCDDILISSIMFLATVSGCLGFLGFRFWLCGCVAFLFCCCVQGAFFLFFYRHMLWHVGIGMSVNTSGMGESRWRGCPI